MPTVSVSAKVENDLWESLYQGPIFDDAGRRYLTEEQVARVDGKSLVIHADEHPPPHFHVKFAGENASFSLADGSRLAGSKGLEKYDRNIKQWWKTHRCALVDTWNRTRPVDCSVGPMDVPDECKKVTRET